MAFPRHSTTSRFTSRMLKKYFTMAKITWRAINQNIFTFIYVGASYGFSTRSSRNNNVPQPSLDRICTVM
jgi:hypothetical protein